MAKDYNKLFDKRINYARSILGDLPVRYRQSKENKEVFFIENDELACKGVYNLNDSLQDFTDELFKIKSYLDRMQAERDKQQIMNKPCEQVDHPQHYNGKYECIEVMRDIFTPEEVAAFCKLNAFKYLWRSNHKGQHEQDIKKANWYLSQLADLHKGV